MYVCIGDAAVANPINRGLGLALATGLHSQVICQVSECTLVPLPSAHVALDPKAEISPHPEQ